MHKLRQEKHAGTDLNTAADEQLINTQGSSAEAGHNATVTREEDRTPDAMAQVPVEPDEMEALRTTDGEELKEEE